MERDLDLIREILLAVEAHPDDGDVFTPKIEGYTNRQISYHIGMLIKAGFVEGHNLGSADQDAWFAQRLTWEGHTFLDAARSDTVWAKAKTAAAKVGLPTLTALVPILIQAAID